MRVESKLGCSAVLCLFAALVCVRVAHAQDDAKRNTDEPLLSFHVTSVTKSDVDIKCSEEKPCYATKYTVDGYTKNGEKSITNYVLECIEIMQIVDQSMRIPRSCAKLHANHEYGVSINDDWVFFGGIRPQQPGSANESAYKVVSEKEVINTVKR